ncbi:MAG: hypothetical protein ACR2OH_08060 [Microthrixaceae bacterium]
MQHEVRAAVEDPYGVEVVKAWVEATMSEPAAVDAPGIPVESKVENLQWLSARRALADYFLQSAEDSSLAVAEATVLDQRSLELVPLSNPLGLTDCVGE